jgi:hypothetical protein
VKAAVKARVTTSSASVDNEAAVFFGANDGFLVVVVEVVAELFFEAEGFSI